MHGLSHLKSIRVGTELLSADMIFINVGGRAVIPSLPGVDEVPYLTNSSMMDIDFRPNHLVIVGGGYVGLEFSQMFRRFGSKVTILEMGPHLIGREDEDSSQAVEDFLREEEIDVRLNAKCIGLRPHENGVMVTVDCKEGDPEVIGSHVLLATGRRPNTDDLGIGKGRLSGRDKRGGCPLMKNSQPICKAFGRWATAMAEDLYTHCIQRLRNCGVKNLLDGDSRRVSGFASRPTTSTRTLSSGRAGLTESEARKSTRNLLVGQRPMTQVGRAVEKGETKGFMKILVDGDSKQILGAAILGTGGDEAIHCVLDMMYAKAPYTVMQRAVHIHPTVSELLPTILGELKPAADATTNAAHAQAIDRKETISAIDR